MTRLPAIRNPLLPLLSFILLGSWLPPGAAFAQTSEEAAPTEEAEWVDSTPDQDTSGLKWSGSDRPKIGLALSGGGAKGCAHVGVLQVLEDLNIPVDYIAGTSMGAVVGGLYAAGVSTDKLEEMLVTLDWDDLLQDDPARKFLSYRRKDDDRRYQTGVDIGLKKWGLKLPTGMRSGQKLGIMLSIMTEQVAEIEDFGDLPIPFYAVATDIGAAEQFVIKEGDLSRAIRASMAIPGFFTAVQMDGRTLVDGGSTNNVPVDVVREMGADIVIAVDIGAQFSDEEMVSLTRILGQTMGMLTRINMKERLEMADYVITPPVSGTYGTMDFNQAGEIIAVGVEEALLHTDNLRYLSIDPEAFHRHRERQVLPTPEPLTLDFVEFTGNERVDDRQVEAHMPFKPGDTLDFEKLTDDLGTLFGRGDFKSVGFSIESREEEHGLIVRLEEKPWGPTYLHAGINFTTNLDGDSDFSFLTNITATQLNSRGGEWRNDLRIGADLGIFSEFYQPLNFKGSWFFSPALNLERRRVRFFEDQTSVAELKVGEFTGDLDFGYVIGRSAEIRAGLHYGDANVSLDTGVLPPEDEDAADLRDITVAGFEFEINLDRLDNVAVPHQGSIGSASYYWSNDALGADDEYEKLELFYAGFTSFGKHTIFGSLEGGWSPGSELPVYDEFTIGGFLSLSGFFDNQLRGQYKGVARAGYYYNFTSNWHFGGWLEAGNVWETQDAFGEDLIKTATIFLGAPSFLGPIHIAWGIAEDGDDQLYISVGKLMATRQRR